MKALIADDDPVTRHLLKSCLEQKFGYQVIQAADGQLAWEILELNPDISLLITDMKMPRVDGREFITRIKSNSKLSNIPIVIISGVVSLNEIMDLLELGASRFLPKPINMSDLVDYITALTVVPK